MNFMNRNRQPLSILLAGAILTTITLTPVSAEYNPKLGRFMQRDPNQTAMLVATALVENGKAQTALAQLNAAGQYTDGMSLYQYQRSNPVNFRDPSGEVLPLIVIALLVGAVAGAIGGVLREMWTNWDNMTVGSAAWSALKGGGAGALGGAAAGAVGMMAFASGGSILALMAMGGVGGAVDASATGVMAGQSGWELASTIAQGAIQRR